MTKKKNRKKEIRLLFVLYVHRMWCRSRCISSINARWNMYKSAKQLKMKTENKKMLTFHLCVVNKLVKNLLRKAKANHFHVQCAFFLDFACLFSLQSKIYSTYNVVVCIFLFYNPIAYRASNEKVFVLYSIEYFFLLCVYIPKINMY